MKGGRTAPRDDFSGVSPMRGTVTSMKGGRTAPRDADLSRVPVMSSVTSMKGGRTAPRDFDGDSDVPTCYELQ